MKEAPPKALAFPDVPIEIADALHPSFAPAHEAWDWACHSFVNADATICNPDHEHLRFASVLFVWSSATFKRSGKVVVATAQTGLQQGSLGKREFLESRFREWNGGSLPDFVVTLCAPYFRECDPTSICATVEHELYHCGQEKDAFGFPKYKRDSTPKFALRGHDVEEFVGVVRRYGAHSPELMDMRNALMSDRSISPSRSEFVCGCGARL